ncbi:SAM-dependent methyltransferase [Microbispora triticiradicis]|uniref:SAM-dependent methyltransferase n=3 Tax=Microbispora TaxID=2005 RepID=A0ABY3LSN3_9ACTN|nr:SAM-dependent methyltransferase [Microbispora triticiradicis]TLP64066.1 SAM-dependent methyltransferase [Microbispora fusca]TYB51847.1 SAM-dependent methyltransferase [Microbispora tritici]
MVEDRDAWGQSVHDEQAPDWVIDPSTPSVARMYDYYLGGKDNFAADREAAEKIIEILPNARDVARANRAFLVRAVRHLAGAGIRQFLDVGTGLPTQENVHQVAQAVAPDSRVVYVDNDPIVLVHARALLADNPRSIVVAGDMREPKAVLTHPAVLRHLDFSRPVALIMLAVLHFVVDDAEAARIVGTFRDALAPGSHVVISHGTPGDLDEDAVRRSRDVYATTTSGGAVPRTTAQVRDLFDGLRLLEPGVVPLEEWRPEPPETLLERRHGAGIVGGVAVIP